MVFENVRFFFIGIYRSEYPQHKVRYYYCYNGQSRQEQGKMLVRCVVQYAEMSIGSKYIPLSGKTLNSSVQSVVRSWVLGVTMTMP